MGPERRRTIVGFQISLRDDLSNDVRSTPVPIFKDITAKEASRAKVSGIRIVKTV